MDKSWMKLERCDSRYIQGIVDFVEFAKQNGRYHMCPCRKCLMVQLETISSSDMFVHLINNGMMRGYTKWTSHGEECNEPSAYMLRQRWLAERYGETSSGMMGCQPAVRNNPAVDIIEDAFAFRNFGDNDGMGHHMNVDDDDGAASSRMAFETYSNLVAEAQTPLYPTCEKTVLHTILRAMQVKVESRMSDNCFNKVLRITKEILPRDNQYPSSYKAVKKVLKNLGLRYQTIHACEYGCILYYEENKDLISCPECGEGRYVEDPCSGSMVPKKTVRYFPLTPKLQRLYMTPHLAGQMRWHAERRVDDSSYIRHPTDGESWKQFDEHFRDFASEARNVRLALATDGFNPFGALGSSHSTWPIVAMPYNLPPHICMKKEMNILCMLISGPKSPGKCLNVFMRPLIDELKMLWNEGVQTFDRHDGSTFTMRAAVMSTISDFPGLGMLAGCTTKGYKACPICLDDIDATHLTGRMTYQGHRRWLPRDHAWRYEAHRFNGNIETRDPPPSLSGCSLIIL